MKRMRLSLLLPSRLRGDVYFHLSSCPGATKSWRPQFVEQEIPKNPKPFLPLFHLAQDRVTPRIEILKFGGRGGLLYFERRHTHLERAPQQRGAKRIRLGRDRAMVGFCFW